LGLGFRHFAGGSLVVKMHDETVSAFYGLLDAELAFLQNQGSLGPQQNSRQKGYAENRACKEQAHAPGDRDGLKAKHVARSS
jgi:hypothetical protein